MLIQTIATVAAGTVAAGAALAGAAVATAAPDGDLPTIPCGAVWQKLPQDLRDDLSALEEMTPRERRAALRTIGRDARRGDYGDRVERVAERWAERRADLTPQQRRELRREVAQRLAERRATCAAEGGA